MSPVATLCVIGGCSRPAVIEELREGNPTPYIAAYCEDHRRPTLTLDPRPLRLHDSEEDTPDSFVSRKPCECGCRDFNFDTDECMRCGKGDFGPIPFEPWHKSVYELARLLRWLELVDELPRDIPLFLETALSWSAQYDLMNEACSA